MAKIVFLRNLEPDLPVRLDMFLCFLPGICARSDPSEAPVIFFFFEGPHRSKVVASLENYPLQGDNFSYNALEHCVHWNLRVPTLKGFEVCTARARIRTPYRNPGSLGEVDGCFFVVPYIIMQSSRPVPSPKKKSGRVCEILIREKNP